MSNKLNGKEARNGSGLGGILAYARFDQSDVLVGCIINDYEKRRQI